MQPLKLSLLLIFTLLISTINSSEPEDWNYIKHGEDWDNFTSCGKGDQSPAIIESSKAEELDDDFFFYANLNVKNGQSLTGTLKLIEKNNILSLEFPHLGNVIYNMDAWGFKKYDESEFQEAQCYNLVFKIPGEHTFNDESFVGELQVNCSFVPESATNLRGVFISIPIKIDESKESQFSKTLQILVNDKTTIDNLPKDITFDAIDIIDGFVMQDGVYYYEAQSNYPPCDYFSIWFYVNKPVYFSQKVIDQLKECLDKNKCPDGNNRYPFSGNDVHVYGQ